jgi:hypothetical protein
VSSTRTGDRSVVLNTDEQEPTATIRQAHDRLNDIRIAERLALIRLELDIEPFAVGKDALQLFRLH